MTSHPRLPSAHRCVLFAVALSVALFSPGAGRGQTTYIWSSGDIITGSITPSSITTVVSGGTLNITTGADHDFNTRALVNNGTVNWQQGNLRSGNGGSLTNNAAFNDSASGTTSVDFNAAYGGAATFTNAATGTYTKTAAGQTNFSVPFYNDGALVLSAGTINLQGGGAFSATATATTATGATLYFNSNYSIASGSSLLGTGSYQLSSSTLTMTGTVSVNNFILAAGALAGTQTFAGGVAWTGTELGTAGTTTNATGSILTISGTNDHNFNTRALVNNGTVNWTGGNLRSGNGGSFTNNAAFNDSASGTTSVEFNAAYGGAATFTNAAAGTYTKTATGQTNFTAAFVNAGNLTLSAGLLNLVGGGSFASTGVANAANGTTLYFNSNYTLASGAALNGTGTYWLYNGTLTMDGALTVNSFASSGGALAGAGTLNVGTLTFTGGTLGGAAVNLTGAGSTWSTGNMNAGGTTTIASGGTLALSSGADHDFNTRTLVNNGTVNWTGGNLRSGNGGSFTNNAAFDDTTTSSVQVNNAYGGTMSTFTNAATGTYAKTGTGTTTFTVPFNNSGAVNVTAGTLLFSNGGTNSGTFTTGSSGALNFNSSYTITDGSSLLGTGTYQATAGTFTVNGNINVAGFQFSGGTLAGTHTFTGALTWNGGNLNSAGTTTISSSGTFNLAGNFDHDFTTRSILNNGTVNWLAGAGRLRSGGAGTITNNGIFNDAASSAINSDYGGTALVFTNATNGTYNKTAAGTTRFDTTFDNDGAVNITAGTFQLNGGGTLSASGTIAAAASTNVIFSTNYTLANASSLTGAGAFSLIAGTLSATGTVNVSNFAISGGVLAGTQTFNGGLSWSGGNLNSAGTTTIASNATFIVGPNASGNAFDHDFNARTFVNNGTMTWAASAGRLRSGSGGGILNNALFIDAADSDLNGDYGGAAATFTNAAGATYRKTGAGQTSFQVPLLNSGILDVQAGTLALQTNSTFNDGSSMTGAGLLQLAAGLFTANGTMSFSNFQIAGGTIDGAQTFNGNVEWTGGNFNSAGTTTLGGVFTIDSGADHDFSAHAFVNNGTVNWLAGAGRLRSGNAGTFTNQGTFNDDASNVWNNDLGNTALVFTNSVTGTYNKNAAGTTTFLIPFVNGGTINAQAGTLNLGGGGSASAAAKFNVAASATLGFTAGSFAVADGGAFTGPGTVQIAGATVTIGANVTAPVFQLTGGTLGGTQTFLGDFTWSGGNMNAAGTTTIGASSTLTINSGADHDFSAHNFVNNGIVNWTAGRLRSGNAGAFTNNGVFNDTASDAVNNDYGNAVLSFANNGTYNKTAVGTTTFAVPFTNNGALSVNAGSLIFSSTFTNNNGAIALSSGATAQFSGPLNLGTGTLGGTGTITAPSVTTGGLVSPGLSPGTLTLSGNLTLLAASTLLIELGGTTQGTTYDFLSVGGSAALAGTLAVKFTGGFESTVTSANNFTFLTASGLTSAFANVGFGQTLVTTDGLGSFVLTKNATSLTLSGFQGIPEPSTWALMGLGAVLLGVSLRRRKA